MTYIKLYNNYSACMKYSDCKIVIFVDSTMYICVEASSTSCEYTCIMCQEFQLKVKKECTCVHNVHIGIDMCNKHS